MSFLRSIFWFEKGELRAIVDKLRARKWAYEARWEAEVLLTLAAGTVLAFATNLWVGFVYLWLCKSALQSLNAKRFFDPLP